MNAYREAKCPNGHEFRWLTGTPFICPVCKYQMQPGRIGPLTPRESEVLKTMIRGKTTDREISEALCITERTVSNHVHRVLRKLQAKTRTEAVIRALDIDPGLAITGKGR